MYIGQNFKSFLYLTSFVFLTTSTTTTTTSSSSGSGSSSSRDGKQEASEFKKYLGGQLTQFGNKLDAGVVRKKSQSGLNPDFCFG